MRGLSSRVAALLLVVALPFLTIRMLEGHKALLWTEFYVSTGVEKGRPEGGLKAGRAAARAIELLAPLPAAAEAAELALGFGFAVEPQNPAAALELAREVRQALDNARSSWIRRWGLSRLDERARALEARASARIGVAQP